jgi:glycine/D-amino acid oxidase-like deaminating enzyme
VLRAYELWDRLTRDSGRDIISLTGGAFLGRPDSRTVAGSLRAARRWNLPHEVLGAAEIRAGFPTLNPQNDEVGLFEAKAGFVPRRPPSPPALKARPAPRRRSALPDTPVLRWEVQPGAGVRVWRFPPDQHFVVGTHPQHPEVTVACGFSGHGFKFVPVVGEVLADLVTTGSTPHPIGLFDPRRRFAESPDAFTEKRR